MIKKIIIAILLVGSLVLSSGATWLYSKVDSALPLLEGKKTVFGLKDTALVERDDQGIVTIKAKSRVDIAVSTGFIHAQERFFQMDLLRRNSAGELSSLFGAVALDYDKSIRRHRFRERARKIVNTLPTEQKELLNAYTRGVNQGLLHLSTEPFEYLLLRQAPVQWSEEDSILAVFSMYIDLQYPDGQRERTLGLMKAVLSTDVYAFLDPKGSIWDAAIDGSQYKPAPMPTNAWPAASASVIKSEADLTSTEHILSHNNYQADEFPGSNNWAISGKVSSTGSAIVANDMHLSIRVPNTWFRARFEYPKNNQKVSITGATLPGTPNMVIGSNGNIAWGFTNSYGDYSDIIVLQTSADGSKYLTPEGETDFTYHKQIIAIKDEQPVEITIKETIWGPVIGENHLGQSLAYRWVAHDKEAVNLTAVELELAQNVEQAFNIAARSGIPSQNMMVGDKAGNIGWTIMGPLPKKFGKLGETPAYWHHGDNGWQGYLAPKQYPSVFNPTNDRLWTANSRVVGDEMLNKIGNGGYALGARAGQIRDDLLALKHFDEKALLAIGLDDRALFLKRWQDFLLAKVLTEQALAQHSDFIEVKSLLSNDDTLSAHIDSVSYRLVRNFRLNLRDLVFSELNETLSKLDKNYKFRSIRHQIETPLWQLVNQQNDNFMMRPLSSWTAVFNNALQKTLDDMKTTPDGNQQPLSAATWGQQNTTAIRHPLSKGVPFIDRWLDMPANALSGDSYMPKVQGKAFGASERMVVSPGHEETGIFHMPTSQASHPWSPYYGKGHSDWEQGKPSPFLPGETKYTLTLLSY
ncbi:MAG: penicillin acylase family protein [Colwellia sp.]|nr:penicillin acylase family protein [Colwellia sp.]MCW9081643.1 penicillin acylase family protein [Colwellia sp.]